MALLYGSQDVTVETLTYDLQFYHERWRSFKPLIVTTFDGMAFDEAAWDMLDSDEKKMIQDFVLAGKVAKRRLMAERAKARLDW